MTLPVAILAGGLASRVRPLTESIPKAMLPIAGEPFAFHQLRLLVRNGIERVVYLVGHLGELLSAAVGDGSRFGMSVEYVFDGPELRGTAGAIAHAGPLLGDEFFALYGDSYLECDYRAVAAAYRQSGKPALMTVFANEGRWDVSNVEYADGRILAYDKRRCSHRMRHIDYGLGVFRRDVFDGIRVDAPADLADLYRDLAATGQLAAFEVASRFYEVGSFTGIEELGRHLSQESAS